MGAGMDVEDIRVFKCSGCLVMKLSRVFSIGGRLIAALILVWALVFVTHFDWQNPSNAWLRPISLYLVGLLAFLSALLIQSFSKKLSIIEFVINMAIVFVLGCLLFPS